MIIYGMNPIKEAMKNGKVRKVYINRAKSSSIDISGIEAIYMDNEQLEHKCHSKYHQGIVADIVDYDYCELSDIMVDDCMIVICDGIEDPHNLGSIIRTAECAGASGIVIRRDRACEVNDTVYKTSAGAADHIKICQVVNINDAIRKMKEHNIWVYALEAGGNSIYDTDLRGNIAIVIGSEGKGVSALTIKNSDAVISMPLCGEVNSLNASNAAAIAIYEALRQRI